jgi:hypothetical protein
VDQVSGPGVSTDDDADGDDPTKKKFMRFVLLRANGLDAL